MNLLKPTHFCWICGKEVTPETQSVDEHNSVVHKRCQAAKIALASATRKTQEMPSISAAGVKRLDVAFGK
jgi:hypothetical protein